VVDAYLGVSICAGSLESGGITVGRNGVVKVQILQRRIM
jgi:hypothetical protein